MTQSHGGYEADYSSEAAEGEPVQYEHPLEMLGTLSQRHSNSDFPCSLRHGVRHDAVDADDAEREGHSTCDCEHHECERRACERLGIKVLHGGFKSDRDSLVH